ncbi:MAG: hypothetical protein JW761_01205 [Prolixibacteraceae bacterium]|nr:hypothetical protein [Prolixibacteraceae bacterium]
MNDIQKQTKTKFVPLLIFAVAMGFLEAIVVVYLRELYYPGGFEFPLKMLPSRLMTVEIVREFATLLMLLSVAWISGKNFLQRLSAFLFLFGIWDILYYLALKLFLNWPESLFTWDLLFLIPIIWLAPVLAPVICSVVMIFMAFLFDYFRVKNQSPAIKSGELGFMIAGAVIIYFTFTYDVGKLILQGNHLNSFLDLTKNQDFITELTNYSPDSFLWGIFGTGLMMIFLGIGMFIKRNSS